MSLAKEFLLPVIKQTVRERALRWSGRAAQIVVAAYDSDACIMGAVAMVYDQMLRQPFRSRGEAPFANRLPLFSSHVPQVA
jgi:hypothetical protein